MLAPQCAAGGKLSTYIEGAQLATHHRALCDACGDPLLDLSGGAAAVPVGDELAPNFVEQIVAFVTLLRCLEHYLRFGTVHKLHKR